MAKELKLRVTVGEFLNSENTWGHVQDLHGRKWYFHKQRRVRGDLLELTYI